MDNENSSNDGEPLPPPKAEPPIIEASAALSTAASVSLAPKPQRKWSMTKTVAFLLSLFLALFLADGVVSLVDDSLILFFDNHLLSAVRGVLFYFALLVSLLIYGLIGLSPMIPKRWFVPITLYNFLAQLCLIPFLIYSYGRMEQISWGISFCEVLLGLGVLHWAQGGLKFRWPLVPETRLVGRRFSWRNLCLFMVANLFVLLPGTVVYLVICTAMAVNHFSDGFMALRREGLTVQVRKYVRNDGKMVQLVPMAHIGEADFYADLSKSFPTNAIILMEGVSDDQNLLTNKISYERAAASLGKAEQQKEFKPQGELVQADVDVSEFSRSTIDLLNQVMRIHARGMDPWTMLELMQNSQPPDLLENLSEDLLRKRNRHVVEEIHTRLLQSERIIVPWGAAHMPGIAEAIQKAGFHVIETEEHVVMRFGSAGAKKEGGEENYGKTK